MNLSKTEKLLAAKRKLKEFQMNKLIQDGSTKKQNEPPDPIPAQCQPLDPKKPHGNPQNESPQESVPIASNNVNDINHSENHINLIPNQSAATDAEIPNGKEMLNAFEETHQPKEATEIESKTMDVSLGVVNESFPRVQKEYLLEMASAVANVLTNDSEVNSAMDSDLPYRNQFENSYLEEQKSIINDLHVEVASYRSRVSELEAKLAMKEREFENQLERKINPLKEQLEVHVQTTGILIAEKAELSAALNQTQQSARQNSEEVEELSGKLKQSQARVNELEKEVSFVKNSNAEIQRNAQQMQTEYSEIERKYCELRKEKEDLGLETSELRQRLNLKKTELMSMQRELQEKSTLLSLSELRIEQMKDTNQVEDQKHASILLEQELLQVREELKAMKEEKEEAGKQYQNYVKQLEAQEAKLMAELKTQTKLTEDLETREQSYIQRLSEIEQLLQQEKQKTTSLLPLQERQEEMNNLMKNVDELTLEQERLHIILAEKDNQIDTLTKEIAELRETDHQNVDASKLASALQSEQVSASIAVSQNQQLKQQLQNMQSAFASLNNEMQEVTEQLKAERNIGRTLNSQLNDVEAEMDKLKDELKEKESVLIELKKEKLQNAQIADQIQHYQAQSRQVQTLQQELQYALANIEKLQKEKQELSKKQQDNYPATSAEEDAEEKEDSPIVETNEFREMEVSSSDLDENSSYSKSIKKLEERFKETMEKVADLTEEKQRLEHLVLQLQSETETIGEYITLYQKQRAVLQTRAREKEQDFRELLEQRNQQQEQLHKLKVLVIDFLRQLYVSENRAGFSSADEKDPQLINGTETKKVTETGGPTNQLKDISELLDLLTEIKDCKDTCIFEPNFHPCPWCSGKLINV